MWDMKFKASDALSLIFVHRKGAAAKRLPLFGKVLIKPVGRQCSIESFNLVCKYTLALGQGGGSLSLCLLYITVE